MRVYQIEGLEWECGYFGCALAQIHGVAAIQFATPHPSRLVGVIGRTLKVYYNRAQGREAHPR